VGTFVRLYVAWRVFRLLRPLLAVGLIVGAVVAFHVGHVRVNRSAASALQRGAAAGGHDLSRALQRGFERQPAQL
jgi:Na+/H+-translocating membrane pyrophosphatase